MTKMNRSLLILGATAIATLNACSDDNSLSEFTRQQAYECREKLKPVVEQLRDGGLDKLRTFTRWEDGGPDYDKRFEAEAAAVFYRSIIESFEKAEKYQNWDQLSKEERKNLSYFSGCDDFLPLDKQLEKSIEKRRSTFSAQLDRAREKAYIANAYAQRDAADKIIAESGDKQIREYSRTAKAHYSTDGQGIKVDTFMMKDGSIVICKTSINNAGKIVNCK